jgi:MoxR-like ATPase
MMKFLMDYPEKDEEILILRAKSRVAQESDVKAVAGPPEIEKMRQAVDQVYIDPKVEEYIVDVVRATREPEAYGLRLKQYLDFGASPRASISLSLAARAVSLMEGLEYVSPAEVKKVAPDVLRHRIILSYEAEADEKKPDTVLKEILDNVKVP